MGINGNWEKTRTGEVARLGEIGRRRFIALSGVGAAALVFGTGPSAEREPLAPARVRFLRSFQTGARHLPKPHDPRGGALAKRLLVVEHNPLFLEGLALLLQWRTGLGSVCAGSLAEAERVLDEAGKELACVVVDLDLPDGGGSEVLERANGTPTLALVGDGGLERRARALESGAVEVLSTAGPVEDMVAAVERLIG